MKSTENNSSTQVLKQTQPEDFDLVILGCGTGSAIAGSS
jgi:ribose 5-phosphate isomerase RpiB